MVEIFSLQSIMQRKAHNENHFKRNISTTKAINKCFSRSSLLNCFVEIILKNCGDVEINIAGEEKEE